MFNNFYKNRRVLVTGHTGFKGSWLTLWLLELGAKVAGFSLYLPSEPCNFEILGLDKHVAHYVGDIRDYDALSGVFEAFEPEIIFHLAAQPIVRRSYDEPKLTFDTNVGGTVNVLECVRQSSSVKASVVITSDKCYKNVEWVWGYRENDQMGSYDPYGASKGSAEIAINSYCQSFFRGEETKRVASARAGNVIGGGDWGQDRLIPDCVNAWSKGREVIIRNPHATRPWQFVLEPLSGYLWLGVLLGNNKLKSGEAFNFGPKSDVVQPVNILIDTCKKYWDEAQWKVIADSSFKRESGLLKLCCDKALSMLNWKAALSFEETVEFVALWYKEFYQNGENMLEFSTQQIEQYYSLARDRGVQWAKNDK